MTRPRRLLPLVCLLGLLYILAHPAAAMESPLPSSQSTEAAAEGLTATVRAVDAKAHTMEVITGVGHALRLLKVQVASGCQLRVAGAAAQLGDFKAGGIVRVLYRKTRGEMLAEKIESLAIEAREDKR